MAKKKKEEVVEQTTEQPKVDDKVEKLTVKKKPMKRLTEDEQPIKIDLSKPPKEKQDEQPVDNTETEEVQEKVIEETTNKKEVVEQSPEENTEAPVLEEITDEEVEEKVEELVEEAQEAIAEAEATGEPVPENIQKLMDFMKETGGDLEDYVRLNQDYSKLDDQDLLYEYYKQTKPHLNTEEINFLMEDTFSYDEEIDEERDIRRKKLARKEQVADAKAHLDGQKSKYYEDIKAGSKLTVEQQKAVDFFNRYNKETEENQKTADTQTRNFLNKTDQVFNNNFKGFEYNIGDKRFRFNVKEAGKIKETQSDINNFIKKFLNKNNMMEDAKGYHKSLYTAMNADAVANHFYEQGKADALKDSVAKAKNVDMSPRQSHGKVETSGFKFKVIGDNSSDFKFKVKK
tara:strand:+ start:2863 stop:4065 length:1203 start_codon:yes stop_codon:yes gene_type:complete